MAHVKVAILDPSGKKADADGTGPTMTHLRLNILDPGRTTRFVIQVPAEILVSRLAMELPARIGLPLQDQSGQDLEYELRQISAGQEYPLEPYRSLEEAGLSEDDSLHIRIAQREEQRQITQSLATRTSREPALFPKLTKALIAKDKIEDLIRQSMVETGVEGARRTHQVEHDQKLYERLDRLAAFLESGTHPPPSQELRDVLDRVRELLERPAVPASVDLSPRAVASLKEFEELLAQSLAETRVANSSREAENELLARIAALLESGTHPPSSQEMREVLDRVCELLERLASPAQPTVTADLNTQTLQEICTLFESLDTQLQGVVHKFLRARGVVIPPAEVSDIVLVRAEKLRSHERIKGKASRARSNAHFAGGGAIGLVATWATSQDQEISMLVLVIAGFLALIAVYFWRVEVACDREAAEFKIDTSISGSDDKAAERSLAKRVRRRLRKQRGFGHAKG